MEVYPSFYKQIKVLTYKMLYPMFIQGRDLVTYQSLECE